MSLVSSVSVLLAKVESNRIIVTVYSDENSLIPKNTSVIVARVPVTDRKKSGPPPSSKENVGRGGHHKGGFHQQSGAEVAKVRT